MTLTYRSTAGRRLTVTEGDGNIYHLSQSSGIDFLQSGSGATATTVQAELRHFVYVTQFGAACDGTTDDTAAWAAAVAALPAGGGEVRFPAGTRSKGNITITAQNVRFKAHSFSRSSSLSMNLVPAVLANPVISVGDGTTLCTGFQTDGIALEGSSTGAIGLKINGAAVCSYRNFSSQGFTDANVRITSSATQPTTYQFFDGYDIAADASAASIGLDVDYGSQYATALYFSNGTLGAQSGSLWALQIDKARVHFSNTWVTVGASGIGINLKTTSGTTGTMACSNVMVDSSSSTDVLLNMDVNGQIGAFVFGSVTIDGKCTMPAGTTGSLTGFNLAPLSNTTAFPYTIGPMYFIDNTTPYQSYAFGTTEKIAWNGTNFVITTSGNFAAQVGSGKTFDLWTATNPKFRLNNITNGQLTNYSQATTTITGMSGATATASNLIPAGSMVIGVTLRVTTLITGATSFDIGDGTDVDKFGATIAVAAGTTTNLANSTVTAPSIYAAATSIVLTANGSNFTAGAVRLTVHYISLTAESS